MILEVDLDPHVLVVHLGLQHVDVVAGEALN